MHNRRESPHQVLTKADQTITDIIIELCTAPENEFTPSDAPVSRNTIIA